MLSNPVSGLLTLLALTLSLGAVSACKNSPPANAPSPPANAPSPPIAPSTAPSPTPLTGPRVAFETPKGPVEIRVVVARTPEETQRGLMFVDKLEDGRGMLFLMRERRVQSFWMVNTYIPLDMIFIDEDFTVVGLVENAEPLTETPRFVDHPSRYVLEVRGGYARTVGITRGQRAHFREIPL